MITSGEFNLEDTEFQTVCEKNNLFFIPPFPFIYQSVLMPGGKFLEIGFLLWNRVVWRGGDWPRRNGEPHDAALSAKSQRKT